MAFKESEPENEPSEGENTQQPGEDEPLNNQEDEDEGIDGTGELTDVEKAEYSSLNQALEQINSCLDALEKRNDDLNAQLKDLLESNRAVRQEMEAMKTNLPNDS